MSKAKTLKTIANFAFIFGCLFGCILCLYFFWQMLNSLPKKEKAVVSPINYTSIISSSLPKYSDDWTDDFRILHVTSPVSKNVKEILFTEKSYPMEFGFNTEEDLQVTLEIFDSPEQDKPIKKIVFNASDSKVIDLPEGNYWWRFTCEDETVTGKIKVICSEKPKPTSPSDDFTVSYKTKTPKIRFTWNESKGAVSYKIKVADNPEMKNPVIEGTTTGNSIILPEIGKGKWYWQVIPAYDEGSYDILNASEVSSFEVIQKETLDKPVLIYPTQDGEVITKITNKGKSIYKTIYFSWKNDEEAVGYEYKIWNENSKANPVVASSTTDNYFSINPEAVTVKPGIYFWQVTNIDDEGNKVASEEQRFEIIEADFDLVTVFPTDNYTLLSTISRNTRFSWKSNLRWETTLQIATDENFENIYFSDKTNAFCLDGIYLSAGTYYWRAVTEIAGMDFVTPSKKLTVVNQLPAAKLNLPENGKKEVVTPGIPVQFTWNTIEGADYYKFTLFTTRNPDNIVFEKNYITSYNGKNISLRLNMDYMAETNYTWTIQGFKDETENSSRITSKLATSTFRMRIWKPVKLLWPLNGTEYDGIEAITNPDNFVWSSIDTPTNSRIVLYKGSPEDKYSSITNPKATQKMPKFNEGQYFWTVVARTLDGIDISATEMRNFSVREMPKLPMPGMIAPSKNTLVDIDYLINNGPKMVFKWDSLKGITRYILRLFKKEDPSPIFEIKLAPDKTEYTLDGDKFLNTLGKYNGGWYWSIEAQLDYQGELMQQGLTQLTPLTVEIPRNKPGDIHTTEEVTLRYGTDEEFDENVTKKLKNAKKTTSPKTKKTKKSQKDPVQSSKNKKMDNNSEA